MTTSHAAPKPGRNDSCSCGSGKKYKNCCLLSAQPSEELLWRRQHEASARLTQAITQFAARMFGEQIHEAWQDFNLMEFPEPLEKHSEQDPIFMPYFLFQWRPERAPTRKEKKRNAGVVLRSYVEKNAGRLSPTEELMLEQAATQPVSLYDVLWSNPGESLGLRDILIGTEPRVIEHSASKTLRAGDIVYAQVWTLPPISVLGCCAPVCIPPRNKGEVVQLRKKLRRRIARQNRDLTASDLLRYTDEIRATYLDIRDSLYARPILCNTDGDRLIFHTLTFKIASAGIALEALVPLSYGFSRDEVLQDADVDSQGNIRSVEFDWIKEGNAKFQSWDNTIMGRLKISEHVLVVDVNSEKRSRQIRKEVEKRLGKAAVHQSTEAKAPEQMLRESKKKEAARPASRGAKDPLTDPEVKKMFQAIVQQQAEDWVYQKIPALGNRRPIDAVNDADGREIVESLLIDWERHSQNSANRDQIHPDINAVRRLLNSAGSSRQLHLLEQNVE